MQNDAKPYVFLRIKRSDLDAVRQEMTDRGYGLFQDVSHAHLVSLALQALREKISRDSEVSLNADN